MNAPIAKAFPLRLYKRFEGMISEPYIKVSEGFKAPILIFKRLSNNKL